jgi:hypothetical protein
VVRSYIDVGFLHTHEYTWSIPKQILMWLCWNVSDTNYFCKSVRSELWLFYVYSRKMQVLHVADADVACSISINNSDMDAKSAWTDQDRLCLIMEYPHRPPQNDLQCLQEQHTDQCISSHTILITDNPSLVNHKYKFR